MPVVFAEQVKEDGFTHFFGWLEHMKATEALKKSYQPPEAHAATFKNGKGDYNHADVTGEGITRTLCKERRRTNIINLNCSLATLGHILCYRTVPYTRSATRT